MRVLPQPPGVPDHRSADRYLLWLARSEWRSITWAGVTCAVYNLGGVMVATLLGMALDSALTAGDPRSLWTWFAGITLCALVTAAVVPLYERASCFNWYTSAYRTVQVVTARAARLGPTLTRRLPSGEVVAVGTDDIDRIGDLYERSGLAISAVTTMAAISALMLSSHVTFGLIVLVAVPVIVLGIGPLLRPFARRKTRHRDRQAELATQATDLVSGLRVLRGVGGERTVGGRYREESRRVRDAGVRVGWWEASLQAVRELYPGLLLVGIVWYGARLALTGELTIGQLVAFYGYTGSLAVALRHLMEFLSMLVSARVSAARATRVLALEHDLPEPETPVAGPVGPYDLRDPDSGVVIGHGRVTAVVCADPDDATLVTERLGRYHDGEGPGAEMVEHTGGRTVRLRDLPLRETRRRVLVAANDAHLFSGPLREELAPDGGLPEERLTEVVRAAAAEDVLRRSPAGFDAVLTERGREYSGGQQQRLRLARALGQDPEVLILVEPASAVDAHSEAAIAERLPAERAGRATALVTTSPLLLDHADHVQFVENGRVSAEGPHRELLALAPRYSDTVLRTAGEMA
ncbi:ABC transporter ATP-binding protein [Nocardiopsis alba]|uniref:ABC transporter ATP-binding protein n=1 Tax=Nocardiopsis alba TaxID=53437 RepID=UPI0036283597